MIAARKMLYERYFFQTIINTNLFFHFPKINVALNIMKDAQRNSNQL